jgi:DNA-binding CsgD family transcriptional regulator
MVVLAGRGLIGSPPLLLRTASAATARWRTTPSTAATWPLRVSRVGAGEAPGRRGRSKRDRASASGARTAASRASHSGRVAPQAPVPGLGSGPSTARTSLYRVAIAGRCHRYRVIAIDPTAITAIQGRRRASQPRRDRPRPGQLASLTARELEVAKLIAPGLPNGEIADTLVLAEQTVKTHVGRILTKLDLRDRAQVVVAADESGLVTPGEGHG